ncbi:Flp family type IVb pilin [Micromonosporaceae bacterium Da 78-11]
MPNLSLLISYLRDLRDLHKSEEGATAVEYGLLVSLIAIVVIVGVTAFSTKINKIFNDTVTALH